MKLYGSQTSPYVRKVRVVAAERAIPLDFTVDDPWQDGARLHAMNPIGKVPVLELDDGRVLFESLLLIEYLDANAPGPRLLPAEGDARWAALRGHALAHALIDAAVTRLLETRRPEPLRMPERMAREEARLGRILDRAEAELGDSDPERPGFVELMLGVALQYVDFRQPQDWRTPRPRLAALAARLATRPSFRDTQPPGFKPVET
jgi:glutathione S-transferase